MDSWTDEIATSWRRCNGRVVSRAFLQLKHRDREQGLFPTLDTAEGGPAYLLVVLDMRISSKVSLSLYEPQNASFNRVDY